MQTLLAMLLSSVISITMLSTVTYYVLLFTQKSNALQHTFAIQRAQLLAKYYMKLDIRNAGFNTPVHNTEPTLPALSTCSAMHHSCVGKVPTSILRRIQQQDIPADSDLLILNNVAQNLSSEASSILYYIRKSIVSSNKPQYALYRDDLAQQAAALVENILAFNAKVIHLHETKAVHTTIVFAGGKKLEFICANLNSN